MTSTLLHIPRFLKSLRTRQKGVRILAALLITVAPALVALTVAAIIETITWFDPATRIPLAHTLGWLLLLVGAGLLGYVVRQLVRVNHPSDEELAHLVWERDEEIRDRVLDALDLAKRPDPSSSAALRGLAIAKSDALAEDLDPRPFVRRTPLEKASRAALAALGLTTVALLIGRGALIDGANRLLHPSQRFIRPGMTWLVMDAPDSLRIIQGDTLRIAAAAQHSRPAYVDLVFDDGTGSEQIQRMTPDPDDTMRFLAEVGGVRRDVQVWARTGRKTTSDTVRVRVTRRPRIARLNVTVLPPPYTSLDPVILPEGVGDMTALPGSRIHLEMAASRELAEASLLLQPEGAAAPDTVPVELAGREVTGNFRLHHPGKWWLEFMATDSVSAGEPLIWTLGTAEDLKPRIIIHSPDDGALIPDALVVPLAVSADDDYGITRMRLRYRVRAEMFDADSVGEEEFMAYDLPLEQVAPGQVIVAMRWSLANLPLLPTDELHYFIEAWDNDTWSGPKRVRSEMRRLVFPSVDELYAMTGKQETDIGDEMAKMYEKAGQTKQKLEETLTRLRSNPEEMTWDEAHALQQTLDNQQQALEQMQKVADAVQQMRQQASEHNLMSKELLDKYQQLQQLLEQISTPEMEEAMKKLRDAMENLDGEQMRDALEQLLQNQEKLLENLDRNIAILEQLKAERRLDELAQRAENLAERQQQLTEQLETAQPQEMDRLAQEQKAIQQESQELAQDVKEAGEKAAEMNPESSDSLGQIAQEMQSAEFQQPMQSSSQAMQSGQRSQAKQSSRKAQQNLEQLAMRLRQQQQQMVQQNMQQLSDEMDRVFDSVLVISRQEENLRDDSGNLGVASPRYPRLAADQEALMTGMSAVDREVQALMKKTFFVGVNVAGNLARARVYMDEAIRRYTDRRPQEVTGAQTQALAMLHRALLALNQSQQQMMSSSSGTGYQEMMQQLQQMAQQQQQLNQQSGGQMPMPMPGGQMPGPGPSLSQLAAQQRALAEQMKQLEQDSRSMQEILGDLGGLSKDMNDVADDLQDQKVTERTRRLQQRILQRLLDSQRSLQERDQSKERQGELAEDLLRGSPGELGAQTEDMLRQRMLRALEGDYARAWRETIRDYYRALEQDRQSSAGNGGSPSATPQP